jgi:arylformamidase
MLELSEDQILDVSVGIHPGMLTWPSDPGVVVDPVSRVSRGDVASVSELHLGSHTGTHVDPPFHFIAEGGTVDRISPTALVGPAMVVDLTHVDGEVAALDLEAAGLEADCRRVLMKTRNSEIWSDPSPKFPASYVSLSAGGARWMVERRILLVGIDFLSIEKRGNPGHPTHLTLLGAGVVIVEGLNLSQVQPGEYTLVCLPLKIIDGDGAPARALLLKR